MSEQVNNTTNGEETAAQEHPSVAAIKANFDNKIDFTEFVVHFKTDKELGIKRPSFTVSAPVPSVEGIIHILQTGGKQLDLLRESLQDTVNKQLRAQVNELIQKGGDVAAHMIDVSKLTWEYIASLTKAEKAVSAIAKETWDAFSTDYVAVITSITGIDEEKAALAAKHFSNKFRAVRGKKNVLNFLQTQLDIWYSQTKKAEDFEDVYVLLNAKVQELLLEDEESLLENLGA